MGQRGHGKVAAGAVVVAAMMAACSSGPNTGLTGQDYAAPSHAPVETVASPTALSSQQLCATVTPQDMAPLVLEGPVTNPPTPTSRNGLPGCSWPLRDTYGSLTLTLIHPPALDAVLGSVPTTYPVGTGTGYQFGQGHGLCMAWVRTPATPPGFALSVDVDGNLESPANVCEQARPQTQKVLTALGW